MKLFSQILQICMNKTVLKLRHDKWSIFGSNLEGPAEGGGVCLSLQILQSMVSRFNHALLSLRGCGEYLKGYALCRWPPLSGEGCVVVAMWWLPCWVY